MTFKAPRLLAAVLPSNIAFAAGPVAEPSMGGLVQMGAVLLIVLALIAGAAWMLRRLTRPPHALHGGLRIVSVAAVGQRERVMVLEIGPTWLVVGVAPGSVRSLYAMPSAESGQLDPASSAERAGENAFARWLREKMERHPSA
jgi:flagellar protein FliO/FliZ